MNGIMCSYEMAPIFNLMELIIFEFFRKEYLNWKKVDGILSPGMT